MNIQLTCRHCKLPEELRDYAVKKIERVLRHFDGVHSVELILTGEGAKQKAEMIVGTIRGQGCVAEDVHKDAFAAVDLVVDKIDGQIRKLKGRLRNAHGKTPEGPAEAGE